MKRSGVVRLLTGLLSVMLAWGLYATAVVLLVMVLLINSLSALIARKVGGKHA